MLRECVLLLLSLASVFAIECSTSSSITNDNAGDFAQCTSFAGSAFLYVYGFGLDAAHQITAFSQVTSISNLQLNGHMSTVSGFANLRTVGSLFMLQAQIDDPSGFAGLQEITNEFSATGSVVPPFPGLTTLVPQYPSKVTIDTSHLDLSVFNSVTTTQYYSLMFYKANVTGTGTFLGRVQRLVQDLSVFYSNVDLTMFTSLAAVGDGNFFNTTWGGGLEVFSALTSVSSRLNLANWPGLTTLAGVANFAGISGISVTECPLATLSALSSVTSIRTVSLAAVPVTDLSPLFGLPLSSLILQDLPAFSSLATALQNQWHPTALVYWVQGRSWTSLAGLPPKAQLYQFSLVDTSVTSFDINVEEVGNLFVTDNSLLTSMGTFGTSVVKMSYVDFQRNAVLATIDLSAWNVLSSGWGFIKFNFADMPALSAFNVCNVKCAYSLTVSNVPLISCAAWTAALAKWRIAPLNANYLSGCGSSGGSVCAAQCAQCSMDSFVNHTAPNNCNVPVGLDDACTHTCGLGYTNTDGDPIQGVVRTCVGEDLWDLYAPNCTACGPLNPHCENVNTNYGFCGCPTGACAAGYDGSYCDQCNVAHCVSYRKGYLCPCTGCAPGYGGAQCTTVCSTPAHCVTWASGRLDCACAVCDNGYQGENCTAYSSSSVAPSSSSSSSAPFSSSSARSSSSSAAAPASSSSSSGATESSSSAVADDGGDQNTAATGAASLWCVLAVAVAALVHVH